LRGVEMPTWFWKEHASTAFMIQILKKMQTIWFYFFWRRN
jgi:hypothetical protein